MFEFLQYIPTPEDKYQMGYAQIRDEKGDVYLYKIIAKKDGSGFFPAPISTRINGEYVHAHIFDSNTKAEDIKKLIIQGVKDAMEKPKEEFDDLPF